MGESDSQVAVGTVQAEVRMRIVRTLLWISIAAVAVYAAYSMVPLFDRNASINLALASSEFDIAKKRLMSSIEREGEERESYFHFAASGLVEVVVQIRAVDVDGVPKFQGTNAKVAVRYDRLVLWLGFAAVLALTYRTLIGSPTGVILTSLGVRTGNETARARSATPASATAIGLFEQEVKSADSRAEGLFVRSTLLLSGGIIMAFIGVVIFYVTLPDGSKDDSAPYWLRAVRPTGVLIFVESIAWFLLRQYRALIEDYKWFHRLYIKRANYLAALRVLDKDKVRPEDIFIAASLVQEDLSGKLAKGESTEGIEKIKISEEGPVTEILRVLTSLHWRDRKNITPGETQ
jgi:hypothetical protein